MKLSKNALPIRIAQFGDGNFIRAYIDWMIHQLNSTQLYRGSIASIQSTHRGTGAQKLAQQNGDFHVVIQGKQNGEYINEIEKITSIETAINPYVDWDEFVEIAKCPTLEVVFSNTTEAGIVNLHESFSMEAACQSFPAKLVQLLYIRYLHFNDSADSGLHILPLELIDENGETLKALCFEIMKDWQLPEKFQEWFQNANHFYTTLVDRIVSGFPEKDATLFFEKIGNEDPLLTVAEPYHLFVIEGNQDLEKILPLKQAGINVIYDSVKYYRNLKVNLLNAPHTIMANLGQYFSVETVQQFATQKQAVLILQKAVEEIIQSLEVNPDIAVEYYKEILERFQNPYMHHQLASIQLSNFSKIQSRLWPNIERYVHKYDSVPSYLTTILFLAFVEENQLEHIEKTLQQWTLTGKDLTQIMSYLLTLGEQYEKQGKQFIVSNLGSEIF